MAKLFAIEDHVFSPPVEFSCDISACASPAV